MVTSLNTITKKFNSERFIIAFARISLGLLWINNASWKTPVNDFGKSQNAGLYMYTNYGVSKPVFGFWRAIIENIILPNFTFFGWMTLITEASLGAFLIVGLATRFWSLVGAAMAITISLTVLNAPNEWPWSYYLLIVAQLLLFATKAGRYGGLDGILRDKWTQGKGRISKILTAIS